MSRKMSLPHERRKAQLKARVLQLTVRKAETNEALRAARAELAAMKPNQRRV